MAGYIFCNETEIKYALFATLCVKADGAMRTIFGTRIHFPPHTGFVIYSILHAYRALNACETFSAVLSNRYAVCCGTGSSIGTKCTVTGLRSS